MGDTPSGPGEGPTDDVQIPDPAEGDLPEIACTLTDEQADRRLAWAETELFGHVEAVEEREDGFSVVFDRDPEAYAAVAELAWKESQCCAFATFEVELPPDEGPIRWHGRAAREEGAAFFAEALRELLDEYEDLPAAN